MPNIDWVSKRSACSAAQMFAKLKLDVDNDVQTRNKLRGDDPSYAFRVAEAKNRFSVLREGSILHGGTSPNRTIDFLLDGDEIRITEEGDVLFSATVTMNDEGDCKFKVKSMEKESWQLRKDALEDVFFVGI